MKLYAAFAMASEISRTIFDTSASSSPCPMIRISGSVPEALITNRPPSPRRVLPFSINCTTDLSDKGRPRVNFILCNSWGTFSYRLQTCDTVCPCNNLQQLQRRHQPVTGRGKVRQDNMSRLLTTNIIIIGTHAF